MHRLLLTAAAVAAFALAASSSAARQAGPAPAAALGAKAEGERILAAAQAGDLFENITEGDGVTRLRHKDSGMVCAFDAGARGNLVAVYQQSPATPNRGDDVSCGHTANGATYTIYATHYRPMPSLAQDMGSAVAGIRSNWTDLKPLETRFNIAAVDRRTEPLFAAFTGRHPQGWDAATFVIVAHVDGWAFKTRASGPVADAEAIAAAAGSASAASLPAAPATPGR